MNGWFDVNRGKAKDFYFVLKAGNGEVVLMSEMYESTGSAEKGIASVRQNSVDDARYERALSSDGKFRFDLKAGNQQVIGTSQLYESESSRDAGIASVKHNGQSRTVKYKT